MYLLTMLTHGTVVDIFRRILRTCIFICKILQSCFLFSYIARITILPLGDAYGNRVQPELPIESRTTRIIVACDARVVTQ